MYTLHLYDMQIFDEPEVKKSQKQQPKVVIENEGGEGGETYDDDKKMNKLLKFNSIIKQNPSQVLR